MDELDQLQSRVVLTLFPLSFFTVMIHLIVHFVEDAKLGGLVQYRWMYPIERYLGKLKSYLRNKAQTKGSIVEGYMDEEALTFCYRYLDGIETIFNRLCHFNDEPHIVPSNVSTLFPQVGKHYKKNVNYLQIITYGYGSVRKLVVTYGSEKSFYIRIFPYVMLNKFRLDFLYVKSVCNFGA